MDFLGYQLLSSWLKLSCLFLGFIVLLELEQNIAICGQLDSRVNWNISFLMVVKDIFCTQKI